VTTDAARHSGNDRESVFLHTIRPVWSSGPASLQNPDSEGLGHEWGTTDGEWHPAIEASGVTKPARIYDLRSTFASNALAAGVTVFELARVMGTSVTMIERHYGALLDGAHAGIAGRLAAVEADLEQQAADAEAQSL
jgi:hypothetical protein